MRPVFGVHIILTGSSFYLLHFGFILGQKSKGNDHRIEDPEIYAQLQIKQV